MYRFLLVLALLIATPLWAAEPRQLNWSNLIPEGAPPPPPPVALHQGSLDESGPAALQSSPDAPVVKALNGQTVKLPGYIVPLMVTEEGEVTEFLLVPYYGACIHVPPPPSNQIVYVKGAKNVQLAALHLPYWVEGALQVEAASSELAAAGYQMQAQRITPYSL
ncbi:hypothetical protein IQ22_03586 [Pseudomonas duriflava]|uniref:DUF3299 domain-containing protein n=1 Tax=Pseudomonas duriflava TaxID=459528 RepID=A0A562Q6Q3_9PSED|nr:DUF3299 domain-containing protein [Pseudomonas duriflava]TWI52441.1 hypothetical protein IQ22_03586 [Pseudomonas duriflava]